MHSKRFAFTTESTADLSVGGQPEQFWDAVQYPDGLLQVLQSVCREVVQSLRVVQAAGVTVRFRGAPIMIAQTAPWVRRVADHGHESGGGPIARVLQDRRVLAVNRTGLLSQWPGLAEVTDDAGIRAVRAEPLMVNGQSVGVFTLFSTDFDVIDPPAGRLTQPRALLIAALTGYLAAHPREDHAVRLQRGLHDRQLIGHAIGILMARHGVNEERARRMLLERAGGQVSVLTAARALIRQHPSVNRPPTDLF